MALPSGLHSQLVFSKHPAKKKRDVKSRPHKTQRQEYVGVEETTVRKLLGTFVSTNRACASASPVRNEKQHKYKKYDSNSGSLPELGWNRNQIKNSGTMLRLREDFHESRTCWPHRTYSEDQGRIYA